MEDVVIIGAGITGCFLAHDLAKYQLKITVIEKENDVANVTTMANSAIIHTGYDPKDGTLKAKLNVKGARMYPVICKELQVEYQRCGAYVVARNMEEIKTLEELKRRADQRGIDAFFLSREDVRKEEQQISDAVIRALSIPETAIINPWQCATALIEEAMLNDTKLLLGEEVCSIEEQGDIFVVHTQKQTITTRLIINAAGCKAQKIAAMIEEPPFHITCKKGEYFVLSKQARDFVHHIIYPVPTERGKGVLAVPTTHGNILLGPNSEPCEQEDFASTRQGMDTVLEQLQYIVKDVPRQEIIRSYCGLRASGNEGDFYICPSKKNVRMIYVACIDSPGLASAPAISDYVIERYVKEQISLKKKAVYRKRIPPLVMSQLSEEERKQVIQRQPLYGKIVCKCEQISYQEIVDAIHSPCGARTIKGIKKRVRPGMGKCQGGFCEIAVAKILSQELHIPFADVLYDAQDSKLGEEAKG